MLPSDQRAISTQTLNLRSKSFQQIRRNQWKQIHHSVRAENHIMDTHLRKKYYEISLVSCMKSSALSTRCPRIDSCRPEWHLLRLYWTMHLTPGWEVPDYHGALSHTLFHNLWVNSLRRGIVLVFLGPFRTFLVFWVALRGSTVQVHKHVVLQSHQYCLSTRSNSTQYI